MSYFEYRVVPAPLTLAKAHDARTPEQRYGRTLELALNAEGREGWEFQRIEVVTAMVKRGWLSRARAEAMTVMVFRRWVETGSGLGWEEGRHEPVESAQRGSPRHESEPPLRSFRSSDGR
jgi:hypothetical protein